MNDDESLGKSQMGYNKAYESDEYSLGADSNNQYRYSQADQADVIDYGDEDPND
jgi:hypothetical protein